MPKLTNVFEALDKALQDQKITIILRDSEIEKLKEQLAIAASEIKKLKEEKQ